jgi:hypothetical protein
MHNRKILRLAFFIILLSALSLVLSACELAVSESLTVQEVAAQQEQSVDPKQGEDPDREEVASGFVAEPASPEDPQEPDNDQDQVDALAEPEQDPDPELPTYGPDTYPEGINPLTGLLMENPEVLQDCPLLVAISNFPPSSRKNQSGLSEAAFVWETFIGEGMTRYLAVYYGDYAEKLEAIFDNPMVDPENFVIGPVRSGRVAFEDIKTLYPGALLITAGASEDVKAQLTNRKSVYNEDPDDINSAGLKDDQLGGITCLHGKPSALNGLAFHLDPPTGGSKAEFFQVIYNWFNRVAWKYDPESGAYLRSQDQADGTGEYYPTLENLTGEQLAFENVLVLFADHQYLSPTVIEISLMFVKDQRGLLFRDGHVYPVQWETRNGDLSLYDELGNPVPLRPGSTFVEVLSYQSSWNPEELIARYHNP